MSSNQHYSHELVIITGMSGAGKTVAVQSLEDLGYYCVDNIPPELLPMFLTLLKSSEKKISRIAVVMDLRGREFFGAVIESLDALMEDEDISPHIVFLDAENETLVRRYKESRRAHPLAPLGLPLEGIELERQMLSELKGRAKTLINTTKMKPRQLRERLIKEFSTTSTPIFTINVMSFGFKHGLPIDADLVFDVRFLKNPYYVEELRHKTGLQTEVSSYVLATDETQTLIAKLTDLFQFMIPQYKAEGKSQLVIAFGCTGGQHRSVTLAEYFGHLLGSTEQTAITHRDINHTHRKD
ncbi:MAG: RNase adapter RapZ [Lysinibacillus sp.]